jgi:ubiquinone/menaquinone biosynthesis C-methylase UbiE
MAESSFLNPARTLRAAKLREGERVADFGAGSGFFTRAAARLVGEEGLVWAVDVHQDLLPRLKNLSLQEGLRNVEVVHGDVERAKGSHLPADNFELVIISNLLFSAEHKEAIAKEAHRVLRKNGRVLVIDWAGSFGGLGPEPSAIITADHAQTLFELNGFRYAEAVPAGTYHWGILLRKKA